MGRDQVKRPFWKRLRRWLLWMPLLLVVLTGLQVLALRFLDPPYSAFMLARQWQAVIEGDRAFRLAYDWRDRDDISPHLPLAAIAAEDQNFSSHHGFDFAAIEKARRG